MTEYNELQRFKHIVATIALEHPDMSMRDGIRLALALEEELAHQPELLTAVPAAATSVTDPHDIAAWLWDMKGTGRTVAVASAGGYTTTYDIGTFWDHMLDKSRTSWKIQAIKEARGLTGAGLREAKLAVELIDSYLPARSPRRSTSVLT